MGALNLFLALALATTSVNAAQFFCVGTDCKNVTLYLGPRFGSKTIQLSPLGPDSYGSQGNGSHSTQGHVRYNSTADFWRQLATRRYPQNIARGTPTTAAPWRYPTVKRGEPRVYGTYRPFTRRPEQPDRQGSRVVYGTYPPMTHQPGWPTEEQRPVVHGTYPPMTHAVPVGPLIPRVRPVLQDGSQTVDLTGDDIIINDEDWYRPRNVEPEEVTTDLYNVDDLFFKGMLNLSDFGFSGEDVKEALDNRSAALSSATTRLLLNDNLIKYLPARTFPLELEYSLNQLWMDNNPLGYLSASTIFEISRLGSLKLLSLSNNSLTYLNSLSLPQLEVLYLKHNFLMEIPKQFHNLRQLHLTNNRISYITHDMISSFPDLRLLDLSSNRINYIFDHPFIHLSRLETLYLNNNSLTDVKDIDVPHSAILFIGSNPLTCSCPLARMVSERWPAVVDKEHVKCTDDNYHSYKLASSVGLAPCRDPWSWWWAAGRVFEQINRWCSRMGITWHNISNILYWALLLTAFYAVIKVLRSRNYKRTPSVVPYNILDDNNAIMEDKMAAVDYKNKKNLREISDKIAIIDDKRDP